jgi:hypothetical protein
VDYSSFTDVQLRDEIEAMRLALAAPHGNPFDGSEARLRAKIDAVEKELRKRNADRT